MRRVRLPRSLDELWVIFQKEPEAALYAGGTDLLVKIRHGDISPDALICLERVRELTGIADPGEEVFIGAATSLAKVMEDPLICREFPVLAEAIKVLGSPPIRHMGTIGGNIVSASPAGDTLPPLTVLDAEVEVRSASQTRRPALRDFILGPGSVDLRRGEILAGVWLRKAPRWNLHHYEKVGKRKGQFCAIASLAAICEVTDEGIIQQIRLAWGSVGATVVTVPEAEQRLIGARLSVEALREVAPLVEAAVAPISDLRAGAEYRRTVAGALPLRLASRTSARSSV